MFDLAKFDVKHRAFASVSFVRRMYMAQHFVLEPNEVFDKQTPLADPVPCAAFAVGMCGCGFSNQG
jgi:hypothetical protein